MRHRAIVVSGPADLGHTLTRNLSAPDLGPLAPGEFLHAAGWPNWWRSDRPGPAGLQECLDYAGRLREAVAMVVSDLPQGWGDPVSQTSLGAVMYVSAWASRGPSPAASAASEEMDPRSPEAAAPAVGWRTPSPVRGEGAEEGLSGAAGPLPLASPISAAAADVARALGGGSADAAARALHGGGAAEAALRALQMGRGGRGRGGRGAAGRSGRKRNASTPSSLTGGPIMAGVGASGGDALQVVCGGPPGDFVATRGVVGGVVEGMGWHEAQAIGVKCAARTRYPHCHLVKVVKRKSTVAEATTVAQAWLRLYNTLMGAGYTTSDFWEAVRSRVPEMGECPGIAGDADDDSPPEWLARLGTITREELLERCGLRDEQLEAPFEKDLADRQSAYQTKQGMLPDAARARVLQDLAAERARREARVLQQRPVVPAAWEPAGGGPAGAAASVAVRGELAGATAVVDLSGDGALGGCAPMRGPWGGAVPDAVGGERKRAAVAMLADSGGEGGGVAGGPGEGAGAAGVGGEPAGEDAAMIQAEIVAAVEEGDEVVAAQWLAELGAGAAAAFTRERKGEAMRRRDMVAAKRWLRLSTGTKTRAPAGARASPPLPGFVPIKLEGAAVADVGGGGRGGGAAAGGAPGGYMGAGVPALFPVSAGPVPHDGGGRGGGAVAGGAPGGHVVAEVPALLPAPAGVVPYGGMGGVMWPGSRHELGG